MKKIVPFSLVTFLYSLTCFAQVVYNDSTIQVGKLTYTVSSANSKWAMISNSSNYLQTTSSGIPGLVAENVLSYINTGESEKNKLRSLLETALGRRYDLLLKEKVIPKYLINGNGEILEISFVVNKSSNVTPSDLAIIENTLKEKYTFDITNDRLKNINYVPFFWPIN